jgi:hypothetical protein
MPFAGFAQASLVFCLRRTENGQNSGKKPEKPFPPKILKNLPQKTRLFTKNPIKTSKMLDNPMDLLYYNSYQYTRIRS